MTTEIATSELHGQYRDVLRGCDGRIVWDRGWLRNTIVMNCRRLLAGFMAGPATSLGIQGLRVGQGLDAWDQTGPPQPRATQTALVDPNPFLVPRTSLQIDYLEGATVTPTPTNRLQIVATLGPNVPKWPDANHVSGNLREFGLVGQLSGAETLINYVTHPVIVKDPASTLTRTIWLAF
jgi:hypothetical protein